MKDLFSEQSDLYLHYRPTYPESFVNEIISKVSQKDFALDVGTGNGQLAGKLSPHFKHVLGIDISESQLSKAVQYPNVKYQKIEAEKLSSQYNNKFDLIAGAMVAHWLNLPLFYQNILPLIHSQTIVIWLGYSLMKTESEKINEIIDHFHYATLKKYWDSARFLVDDTYSTLHFPLEELRLENSYKIERMMNLETCLAYINTWSASQIYLQKNGYYPSKIIEKELLVYWNTELRVYHSLFCRIGRMK